MVKKFLFPPEETKSIKMDHRQLIDLAAQQLEQILKGKVDPCHGIDHALIVVDHVNKALERMEIPISDKEQFAVKMAALLHDADDGKFFSTSIELTNARNIMENLNLSQETIDLVLKMINLVSCSKNGNSRTGVEEEWMLYPRFADRLEALGEIGLVRCWVYTYHINRPLFTHETPRPKNLNELREAASPNRFTKYVTAKGKISSSSFIDHFYDKLLHIGDVGTNPYFTDEVKIRLKIMEDFLIEFGQSGKIDEVYLQKLADKYGIEN